MSLPITSIQSAPIRPPAPIPGLKPSAATAGSGAQFGSVLSAAIEQVNQFQQNADSTIARFLSGEDVEVHKVALATEQASLSFDLFQQVRNKVVSAYQEVMRMQM